MAAAATAGGEAAAKTSASWAQARTAATGAPAETASTAAAEPINSTAAATGTIATASAAGASPTVATPVRGAPPRFLHTVQVCESKLLAARVLQAETKLLFQSRLLPSILCRQILLTAQRSFG